MNKITHDVHGDQVLITVELPGETLTARADGTVSITMEDLDWRDTARGVLKEANLAERKLDPDSIVMRVRESLADASNRAMHADTAEVRTMRMASTVLHRLGDMIQGGTIRGLKLEWDAAHPTIVVTQYTTDMRIAAAEVELGAGARTIGTVVRL